MKKFRLSKIFVLCGLFLSGINQISCTSNPEVQPQNEQVINSVSLNNGRIVFNNEKEFEKTLNELGKKQISQLDSWEKGLKFESLRNELIKDNDEPFNSFKSFGFPYQLSTIINKNGEYQIGKEISWYHDGYRYVASSESELQSIKENPSASLKRFKAGLQPINTSNSNARVAGFSNASGKDARYQMQFYYHNNPNSTRKIIYEVYVYTEEKSPDISNHKKFYTALYLRIKLEWLGSQGYQDAGESRTIAYNILFNGKIPTNVFGTVPTFTNVPYSASSIVQSSNYQLTLGSATIYHPSTSNTGLVQWEFEVTGNISSYISNDPAHTYSVSNTPLW